MQFVKEVTEIDKDEPVIYDPDSENNLWNNCNYVNHYYYAPEWVEIAAPEMTVNGNSYSFALPSATYNQWQAQAHFKTDIKTNASTNYDFCVVINSSKDFNGVTVKLALDGDDDTFYFIAKVAVKAYEDIVVSRTNMPGIDMERVNFVFDFGGCAENTELTLSNIVLKDTTMN